MRRSGRRGKGAVLMRGITGGKREIMMKNWDNFRVRISNTCKIVTLSRLFYENGKLVLSRCLKPSFFTAFLALERVKFFLRWRKTRKNLKQNWTENEAKKNFTWQFDLWLQNRTEILKNVRENFFLSFRLTFFLSPL